LGTKNLTAELSLHQTQPVSFRLTVA